jgi:protein-S-isoprenylcysteine O-methyltransferase Ste14
MHWTQIILAVGLANLLAAFIVALVAVKRSTGANPVGHTGEENRLAVRLNGLASLLMVLIPCAYFIDARSVDWFGRIPLLDHPAARGLGVTALVLSGICLVWGEISLGRSFRVALPESRQPLITHGIYRFTRNPLALSVDLFALGTLLLAPSWLALACLLLNVVGYAWKIRVEEAYLRDAHGTAYAAYCAQAGRYLPRLFKGKRL